MASLRRVEQLKRKLDVHLLDRLMEFVRLVRPGATHEGGVTELEYTLAMLLELEICTWDQVRLPDLPIPESRAVHTTYTQPTQGNSGGTGSVQLHV